MSGRPLENPSASTWRTWRSVYAASDRRQPLMVPFGKSVSFDISEGCIEGGARALLQCNFFILIVFGTRAYGFDVRVRDRYVTFRTDEAFPGGKRIQTAPL